MSESNIKLSYQATDAETHSDYSEVESNECDINLRSPRYYLNRMLLMGGCAVVGYMVVANQQMQGKGLPSTALDSTIAQYSLMSDSQHKSLFEDFKKKYNKSYDSDGEEALRFSNFKSFLQLVDDRNAKRSTLDSKMTISHGITKFADWSQVEFESMAICESNSKRWASLKARKAHIAANAKVYQSTNDDGYDDDTITDDSTDYVDWANIYTTAVKDQGVCGSCWAFSAVEQIETDAIIDGILTTGDELSVQQVVSCDTTDDGCDGGDVDTAVDYVMDAGGLELADEYPYTSGDLGKSGTCTVDTGFFVVTATGYTLLGSKSEMETYVWNTGPLSVCLDASTWSSYTSGIITASDCDTDDINHCVQITGFNKEEKYWIVRNSWGTDWGIDGYVYVSSEGNACDIEYSPLFTSVEAV